MATDYYSILSKAAATAPSAAARRDIYYRARNAVANLHARSDLTPQQVSTEALALEAAIQRIENDLAPPPAPVETAETTETAATTETAETVETVLAEPPPWRRVAIAAGIFIVVIGLAATALWYFAGRNPRANTELAGAAQRPSSVARNEIVPDLDPGVDGGSSGADLPFPLQRQVVFYRTTVVPGSIVVDRETRYLYLIQSDNSARRYGIGISTGCLQPGSLFRITNKVETPEWMPPAGKQASASQTMRGGPGNPLGTRALLLDQPERLIHGTNSPKTIGHLVGTGCIRLVNDDVEDLYRRVPLDTKVIIRN